MTAAPSTTAAASSSSFSSPSAETTTTTTKTELTTENEERREEEEEEEEAATTTTKTTTTNSAEIARKRRIVIVDEEKAVAAGEADDGDEEEEMELDDGNGVEGEEEQEEENGGGRGVDGVGREGGGRQRPVTPPPIASDDEATGASSSNSSTFVFSPELLRMYYSRIFPFDLLVDWLSYDPPSPAPSYSAAASASSSSSSSSSSTSLLPKREFSFTIAPFPNEEIYIRYQSFRSASDLHSAVVRRNPIKIDIGAVFTYPPRDCKSVPSGAFRPVQRELVFDVDLTDYDGVRYCGCRDADICSKCWTMMGMAIKVMDVGLKDDFGFEHVAWFYSGRRGVHAWICDENARMLTDEGRSAVASYFELSMGSDKNKTMVLSHPLHPMLSRAYDILEPMFVRYIVPSSGHGLLATKERWDMVLDSLPDGARPVTDRLKKKWNATASDGCDSSSSSSPAEKWEELKRNLDIIVGKGRANNNNKAAKKISSSDRIKIEQWPIKLVFRHCYPRLDVNVSKMRNHLLKSPFCVHPKTGRVCVPLDASTIESFDPFAVPTLPVLQAELDEYERKKRREGEGESCDADAVDEDNGEDEDGGSKRKNSGRRRGGSGDGCGSGNKNDVVAVVGQEWRKTSLREPFERFQSDFLVPLQKYLRRKRRAKVEEYAAATGDF